MIQSFDTQLEVSLRALGEVVAPALGDAEGHVLEQFNLALATLNFTRQRLPYARRFHRLELRHLIAFSTAVRRIVDSDQRDVSNQLEAAENFGKSELARPQAESEDYVMASRKLRELIGQCVQLAKGKHYETELDAMVLKQGQAFLPAQRAWCSPLGLDTMSDKLPSLEEVLASGE